jgi:hypothetical protein
VVDDVQLVVKLLGAKPRKLDGVRPTFTKFRPLIVTVDWPLEGPFARCRWLSAGLSYVKAATNDPETEATVKTAAIVA